jgi:hypothetical protein
MGRPRKTKKEKLLAGTLRKSREKLSADPQTELEEAREMLEVFKENLRQANKELREHGLMIQTTISDSHGKFTEVRRVNPSLKIQTAALKAIKSLKQQIGVLEEDAAEKAKQQQDDAELREFQEFSQ